MTTIQTKPAKTFTGFHMWILALSFFGVVIGVNALMATLAFTSWTGLVVENSYVASQEFETKRLAHNRQNDAGWAPTLTYADGTMRLAIVDAAQHPVELDKVSLQLNRPVGGHDDQLVELERAPDGSYTAPVKLPAGLWEATVTAADTSLGPFEMRERVKVEASP
ncbi:MAG: FixH family protein [Devosia sp.]